jgi:hypothetical protein
VRAPPAFLLALLASCALDRGPAPEVSAAPGPDGLRVRFRRTGGADPELPPELRAEGGALEQIVVSPDLRAISALWRRPEGRLRCRFPHGGAAVCEAGRLADAEMVRYVFLEAGDVRVTAELPRACLLLPALPLRLHVPEALEPARLVLPDGRSLRRDGDASLLPLTADERGVLRRGDMTVTVETANGPIEFLVGVDDDGTAAAISGYIASPEDVWP